MTTLKSCPTMATIIEILREVADEIELLGEVLCGDEEFVDRHINKLQAIDLLAQTQRVMATLLERNLSAEAIEEVCLDALRQRLFAVLPHGTSEAAPTKH